MPTAVLVDGDFFLRRCRAVYGDKSPEEVAQILFKTARSHLTSKGGRTSKLYRIFFYDCPPLTKKAHNPVTGKAVDFSKSALANFRTAFHTELAKLRKVALRLGYLDATQARWVIREEPTKQLLKKALLLDDLDEDDVQYETRQKGVDMRIGLDIASLAFKHQVDQIVLIAGDSDFVPAAKLARREGIDFVLDPMWAHIKPDLHLHIDGLRSTCPRPKKKPAVVNPIAQVLAEGLAQDTAENQADIDL